jgi:CheY-like chemotaxis protein
MLRIVYNDKSVSSMTRPADPRIILVDDDSLVRLVPTTGLEDHDFDVVEARAGDDALLLLKEGPTPDFVVTDIDLRMGCSGIELAASLEISHPRLTVVLISGRAVPALRDLPLHHRYFLAQPFVIDDLVRLLQP